MKEIHTDSSVELARWLSSNLAATLPRLSAPPTWGGEPNSDGVLASEVFGFAGQVLGITYELATLKNQRLDSYALISRGLVPSFSIPPHTSYSQGSLTDGIEPINSRDPSAGWLGWYSETNTPFVIDIKTEQRYINKFQMYVYFESSPKIGIPRIEVQVSPDGQTYRSLGFLSNASVPVEKSGYRMSLQVGEPVKSGFVRFIVTPTKAWTLIGELEVYASDYFSTTKNLAVQMQMGSNYDTDAGKMVGIGKTVKLYGLLNDTSHRISVDASSVCMALGVSSNNQASSFFVTEHVAESILTAYETRTGIMGYTRAADGKESGLGECAYVRPGDSASLLQADTGASVIAGPFIQQQRFVLPPTRAGILVATKNVDKQETQVVSEDQTISYNTACLSITEPRLTWLMR